MLSQEYISPEVAVTPQEAFYAEKESLPLEESAGRVCSEFVMCYPPGIPILAPGERITEKIVDYIQYAKEKGCSMTGPEDPDIRAAERVERSVLKQWNFGFQRTHTPHVKFSIRVDRQLYSGKSEFQRIDVFDSHRVWAVSDAGRLYDADGEGRVYLPRDDDPCAHGGASQRARRCWSSAPGDGGVIRELTRYTDLEHIDMVEIDALVVEVCKKYLPQDRLPPGRSRGCTIHYEDGLKFIRSRENEYDLIIVDSTDPFGPGEGLFTQEFYGNCYKALKEDGIMVNQHESPFYAGGRRRHASGPTSVLWRASPSARCIRPTSPPIPRAIGCSGLPPRSTTP